MDLNTCLRMDIAGRIPALVLDRTTSGEHSADSGKHDLLTPQYAQVNGMGHFSPTRMVIAGGRRNLRRAVLFAAAASLICAGRVCAQAPPHLSITLPGGMPGLPVVTGISAATNGLVLTWDGPSGYYQVIQKTNLNDPKWAGIGRATNLVRTATIATHGAHIFYRVSGPAPHYTGIQTCSACHAEVHDPVVQTSHLQAFATLQQIGQQTNSSCLPCHTVGNGLPTGFTSQLHTPNLAGVQCENCHGPAAFHAANPGDPTVVPRVEVAATVCGGCHNARFVPASYASQHLPYFEDWDTSAHRAVLPELQSLFLQPNGPSFYVPNCGGCHSGTVREALLENDPLPDGGEAGAVGIGCAVCHDPHQNSVFTNELNGILVNEATGVMVTNTELGAVYTNQLRNPIASLDDYHATGSFAASYNPNINVCAQCHNDRGASTNTVSMPPHHSPQYNMLLGTFSESTGISPNQPATHALLEKQCVSCHMQTSPGGGGQPALSGHAYVVNTYTLCVKCHPNPPGLIEFTQLAVSNQVQDVEALLDMWAVSSNVPPELRAYGTRAWEYSTPGDLNPGGLPGPTPAQQALIPANIQQARLNLYLVLYDGSYGVHNGPYAVKLLDTAEDAVVNELFP